MKKSAAFVFLLLIVLVVFAMLLGMRKQALDAELRRKRDADAYAIRNALVIHMRKHDGALPCSFSELEFERSDVDPSPFSLVDPAVRKGQLGRGIMAEAKQGGDGKSRIVIYADGTVRWEQ